ncbi:LptF/LptG family permease [Bacteroidales bacterium OttesenSCG-928-K03]|nr:LptF/LptG family permease [Odoribacter sp. OttesenSCG-928-L07]MDL2238741.1 LptF/LptG family permease [Bacteroidales bacterium OttesenSCG-928-L14]MDL2240859.1 LptF/LptG family permease [Bacteroidales bacterium OttesenSCG-928-K22]MDL2243107.1 LptF/LptG family permease [Bacteroidales bacterium OttesenSCG-928-K03]
MKKLDLYIIRKYFSSFFLAIILLIIVVIVFDFSEKLDKFMNGNIPFHEIVFGYYANFIPYFFNLFLYLFVFIAVIFFTSKLAQNSEIIAILSSGISFYRLMVPYLFCAIILAGVAFALSNFVIPKTNSKLTEFENQYLRKSAKYSQYAYDIHMQIGPATYAYVKNFNGKTNEGNDFTLERFDFENGMHYKISSRLIKWSESDSTWTLSNYVERTIFDDREDIKEGSSITMKMNLFPKDMIFIVNDLKTMNFKQLNDFIEAERLKGIRNITEYEVEKHSRIANSFATIILTVLAYSLACRKKKAGMGINLGVGVVITFTYILMMQITKVFATNSGLDPWIAAWLPNVFFAAVATVITVKAPK